MAISLFLQDKDEAYGRRVTEWVRVHPESGFAMEQVSVAESAQVGTRCSIMLQSSGGVQLEGREPVRRHLVFLADGANSLSEELRAVYGSCPSVRKYQPIPQMLEEVRHIAEDNGWTRPDKVRPSRCRLTVLLHLSGAGHLQPAAPILSAFCARNVQTVLLCLDPSMDLHFWFPSPSGAGVSRLAFEMQGSATLSARALHACMHQDAATGVRVFRPPALPQDMVGFRASDVEEVLHVAGELGMEALIVDGGFGLSERNLELARMADFLLFLVSSDAFGIRRAEETESLATRLQETGNPIWKNGQEVLWVTIGALPDGIWPQLPEAHRAQPVPAAYPEGFPPDAWSVSDPFLRAMHAIVPGCVRRPA